MIKLSKRSALPTVVAFAVILVMLGWVFELNVLVQISPNFVPMQFNTAFCFLLLSLKQLADPKSQHKLRAIPSFVVMLFASLTALTYLVDIDLGIDTLFIEPFVDTKTPYPGRMSLRTAFCFILLSCSSLLGYLTSSNRWVDAFRITLPTFVQCMSLVTILGYVADLSSVTGHLTYSTMAAHTSIAFLLLASNKLHLSVNSIDSRANTEQLTSLKVWMIAFLISLVAITSYLIYQTVRAPTQEVIEQSLSDQSDRIAIRFNHIETALALLAEQTPIEALTQEPDIITDYFNAFPELSDIVYCNGHTHRYFNSTTQTRVESISIQNLELCSPTASPASLTRLGLLTIAHEPPASEQLRKVIGIVSASKLVESTIHDQHFRYQLSFSQNAYSTGELKLVGHPIMVGSQQAYLEATILGDHPHPLAVNLTTFLLGLLIISIVSGAILAYLFFDLHEISASVATESLLLTKSLNTMLNAVIVINREGIIEFVNTAANDMFMYQGDELIGRNVSVLMPHAHAVEHNKYLSNFDMHKPKQIGKTRVLQATRSTGDTFPMRLRINIHEDQSKLKFIGVIDDLTDIHELEQHRRETDAIIEASTLYSDIGFVITNHESRCISVNPATAEIFEAPMGSVLGTKFHDYFINEDPEQSDIGDIMGQLLSGQKHHYSAKLSITTPHHKKWVQLYSVSLLNDEHTPKVAHQIIDITEAELLKMKVEAHNEQLTRSNDELNQFAYVASHDLKAPINAISALANRIASDNKEILPAESLEHLSIMQSRCARASKLLDDLLLYSRVGREKHERQTFKLRELTDDIVELIALPQRFTVIAPDETITIQRKPLELVLRNLISNAVKHHDKSEGTITISVEADDLYYTFKVSDDGPGVPRRYQARAFAMFATLQSRDEREGSGMGLSFCKKTVEHHNGSIAFDPTYKDGASIIFTWKR